MGVKVTKPITTKNSYVTEGNNLIAGLSSMQGWRPNMEDEHVVLPVIPGIPGLSLFAVFDGHGGGDVSKFLARNIVNRLIAFGLNDGLEVEQFEQIMCDCFMDIDEEIITNEIRSGSTGVLCLFTPNHIITANVGDSRGILYSNKQVIALSEDHKPWHEMEKKRIVGCGGDVVNKRVNGELAVSRSFGDIKFKQDHERALDDQLVIAVPDFIVHERTDQDIFVVLGCDGIFDTLSNNEVSTFVNNQLSRQQDPSIISEGLLNQAFELGSQDNISAMIILINENGRFDSFDITKAYNAKQHNDLDEVNSKNPSAAPSNIGSKANVLSNNSSNNDVKVTKLASIQTSGVKLL